MIFLEKYPEILDFAFLRWYLCTCQPEDNTNRLFIVIQTTEGRKDLGVIHVDVHEIFRRYAPLNDKRFQFLIFNLKRQNYGKKRNLLRIPPYQPS